MSEEIKNQGPKIEHDDELPGVSDQELEQAESQEISDQKIEQAAGGSKPSRDMETVRFMFEEITIKDEE
jgi:hypothetical protein